MIQEPPDFEKAMHGIHTKAKLEAGYNASLYLQMLHRHGGLGTAKQLINSPQVSQGYTRLYELKRLDLTVEALVMDNPKWHSLFTQDELIRARRRLDDYRYVSKA